MASDQGITREFSLTEVVSKTFELYRRNFVMYFILFLIVEAVIGIVDTFAYNAFPLPTLPPHPTSQQVFDWAPGFFGNLIPLAGAIGIVSLVFGTIALGGTIKMASEEIENRPVNLAASARFAATKLLWMWALGLLLGIIVTLGFVLIIPGIIFAIMFSVAFQALLIEDAGIVGSLNRSRALVSHRWLKTLAIYLVLVIIVGIAAAIAGAIASPFGGASTIVSDLLSAFYLPIIPVATTIYFYSNRARLNAGQAPAAPTGVAPPPGMKFCTNCGTQLEAPAVFCPKCGAKQPT